MQGTMQPAKSAARTIGRSLITWSWTRRLVHWIIISAGTMSECVFLIASLWVSVNANVHLFVLKFITEDTARFLTELATTAYVILPECIVGLAVVVTLSHLRAWMHTKDYRSAIRTVLYGMPTIVFMVLSLVTLGCSVANVTFTMPTPFVVIRALAGYWFAFTSLLYGQLGASHRTAETAVTPTVGVVETDETAGADACQADLEQPSSEDGTAGETGGTDGETGETALTSRDRILAYRLANPLASKEEVETALSLSRRTVNRYWQLDETDRQQALRVVK